MKNKESKARHISVWTASAFVISSMIGTGVFTSLGFQLVDIQSIFPLLMLWVIGGVIALFGAISYSELAAALPRSGGEYHLLSRVIHPAVGFAGGFVSEFAIVRGSWPVFSTMTALSMIGLFFTGAYILKAIRQVLHGPVNTDWSDHNMEISTREKIVVAPLIVLMLIIGIWPWWITFMINETVTTLIG